MLLYEMLVGVTPFSFDPQTRRPNQDLPPTELYKNILTPSYELSFPSRLSQDACDCIEDFLSYDPLSRLGELTGGSDDVRHHPFFKAHTEWDDLYHQRAKPPFVPQLKSKLDTSQFDDHPVPPNFLVEPPYDYSKPEWDVDF